MKRRVRELQSILIDCSGKIYPPSQENVRELFRDIFLGTGKEACALFLAASTSISDLVPANVKDVKFFDIKSWWDEEEKMVDWKPLLDVCRVRDTLVFIKAPPHCLLFRFLDRELPPLRPVERDREAERIRASKMEREIKPGEMQIVKMPNG